MFFDPLNPNCETKDNKCFAASKQHERPAIDNDSFIPKGDLYCTSLPSLTPGSIPGLCVNLLLAGFLARNSIWGVEPGPLGQCSDRMLEERQEVEAPWNFLANLLPYFM